MLGGWGRGRRWRGGGGSGVGWRGIVVVHIGVGYIVDSPVLPCETQD